MLSNEVTVTEIKKMVYVHSPKGVSNEMIARKQWGISICLSGQITFCANGQCVVADPAHAILLPQGLTYSIYPNKESTSFVINFCCDAPQTQVFQVLQLRNSQQIIADCKRLEKQYHTGASRLRVFAMFYDLLAELQDQQKPQHYLLSKAVDYMDRHFVDPNLSNDLLARQAGISQVYFYKLFVAHYGTTPKQYIMNLRIQKAKQLLLESPFSVSAVAEGCGFSGVYHFSRVFKEKTGVSPSKYMKENRNIPI